MSTKKSHVKPYKIPKKKNNGNYPARGTPETFVLFSSAILIVFGLLLIWSYFTTNENYSYLTNSCNDTTAGTIISIEETQTSQSNVKVSFDVNGKNYIFTQKITNQQDQPLLNQTVKVKYCMDNPTICYIEENITSAEESEKILGFIFLITGLAFFVLGIMKKIKRISNKKK